MLYDQSFLDKQKRIESKIKQHQLVSKHKNEIKEQKEVAQIVSQSDPAEFSSCNLQGGDVGESRSSIMNSQSDLMLSSAVKLATDSSFKGESGKPLGLKKKKKKAKKRKTVPRDA